MRAFIGRTVRQLRFGRAPEITLVTMKTTHARRLSVDGQLLEAAPQRTLRREPVDERPCASLWSVTR
jgi:hypothetical protein